MTGDAGSLDGALSTYVATIVAREVRRLLPTALAEASISLAAVDRTRVYSLPAAAKALGCSEPTLRRAVNDGRLAHVKLGRVIKIPGDALHRFVSGGVA